MTPTMTPNVVPPSLPTQPIQLPTQPTAAVPSAISRPGQTIIRMAPSPSTPGVQVRPGMPGNIVRVRAPAPVVSGAGPPAGQIKVVGTAGQPQIIKTAVAAAPSSTAGASAAGNMSGIAALAAAAAATSKITTVSTPGAQTITTASGQAIKVVHQVPSGVKVAAASPVQGAQTAVIGGQTVRLASSPGGAATLLKTGTTLAGAGGKQIILQNKGVGAAGQPQVVTLLKTSQGMQVATVPKAIVQTGAKPAGQQIVQAQPGKAIPQVREAQYFLSSIPPQLKCRHPGRHHRQVGECISGRDGCCHPSNKDSNGSEDAGHERGHRSWKTDTTGARQIMSTPS